MSDTFLNDRETAFEAKYAHDCELDFISKTKGGALFATWVASLLKLTGEEAARYSRALVDSMVTQQGNELVLQRIATDLGSAGQSVSSRMLASRMAEFQQQARQSLY